MTLIDLKGHFITRRANLQGQLQERRQTVVLIEADLIRARREADTTNGALQATEHDLADLEAALQGETAAPAKPAPSDPRKPA